MAKEAKNKGGRPTKMTPETVKKLEQGFSMGFTDEEACLYADITKPTLYAYIEKNPEFSDRKEILKRKPLMKAKLNIMKDINNEDINTSKWYLERKAKDEFSTKQEHTVEADVVVDHVAIRTQEIADIMKEKAKGWKN